MKEKLNRLKEHVSTVKSELPPTFNPAGSRVANSSTEDSILQINAPEWPDAVQVQDSTSTGAGYVGITTSSAQTFDPNSRLAASEPSQKHSDRSFSSPLFEAHKFILSSLEESNQAKFLDRNHLHTGAEHRTVNSISPRYQESFLADPIGSIAAFNFGISRSVEGTEERLLSGMT